MVNLAVLNGLAAAFMMVAFWKPEWLPFDPVLIEAGAQWEVVTLCYIGAAGISAYLLSTNPAPEHLVRARFSLMVYFALGLIVMFSGLLVGYVLLDMELMGVDWVLWQQVLVYVIAGSAVPMLAIYLVAHRAGSRSFLTSWYHRVMGTLNAILAVSLILLPFFYLPYRGWMAEAGVSLIAVGVLMVLFTIPAMISSYLIEWRGLALLGARVYG
jgi:hypothetical protein